MNFCAERPGVAGVESRPRTVVLPGCHHDAPFDGATTAQNRMCASAGRRAAGNCPSSAPSGLRCQPPMSSQPDKVSYPHAHAGRWRTRIVDEIAGIRSKLGGSVARVFARMQRSPSTVFTGCRTRAYATTYRSAALMPCGKSICARRPRCAPSSCAAKSPAKPKQLPRRGRDDWLHELPITEKASRHTQVVRRATASTSFSDNQVGRYVARTPPPLTASHSGASHRYRSIEYSLADPRKKQVQTTSRGSQDF
jgi:hypothetical protein